MKFEVTRTFPVSRSKGYELMRDLTRWSNWSPVSVDVGDMTFSFTPVRGFSFTGDLAIVDEVMDERCEFVFATAGFPDVSMTWTLRHAGPGAFTVKAEVATDPSDWWLQVMETGSFLRPTLRRALMSSFDTLEKIFLGEVSLEAEEDKEPVSA